MISSELLNESVFNSLNTKNSKVCGITIQRSTDCIPFHPDLYILTLVSRFHTALG